MAIKREDVLRAKESRGRTMLLKHLGGERLPASHAILAKCCDCMCFHADGRIDCRMPHCALYPWMPYKDSRKREKPPKP